MANVLLNKVEKVYPNGFKAVHGIDLDIKDGEFMVLVGPSGCAKSTLLRMIAGLETITGGEVKIGQTVVNNLQPKERGIAMVFQNYALYPHMKVRENLSFGLKLAKVKKEDINTRVDAAATTLEIEPLLDRLPRQLSGGQAQRVAVGRAIVKRPEVFLFDEPLSNLDAKLRASMRVRITELHKELKERGVPSTVIYVTHDQVEAMTMGERICVMKEGRIMQVDKPTILYDKPANTFVASFIGSPEMNIKDATIVADGDTVAIKMGSAVLPLPAEKAAKLKAHVGKKVQFGVRPEHIDSREANPGASFYVPGRIRIVEHMGHEVFVYFDIEDQPFTARMQADMLKDLFTKKRGDLYDVTLRMEHCHVFDTESGLNISL